MKEITLSFVRGLAFAIGAAIVAIFFFNLSAREPTVVEDPQAKMFQTAQDQYQRSEQLIERSEKYHTRMDKLATKQEELAPRFERVIEKWEQGARGTK